jgi:hypothetical protein
VQPSDAGVLADGDRVPGWHFLTRGCFPFPRGPHAKHLANVLDSRTAVAAGHPTGPVHQPPRATKAATIAQVGLGAWILSGSLLTSGLDWYDYGGGRPKPELYGIWTVDTFTLDGA